MVITAAGIKANKTILIKPQLNVDPHNNQQILILSVQTHYSFCFRTHCKDQEKWWSSLRQHSFLFPGQYATTRHQRWANHRRGCKKWKKWTCRCRLQEMKHAVPRWYSEQFATPLRVSRTLVGNCILVYKFIWETKSHWLMTLIF